MKKLCGVLEQNNYCDEKYISQVMKREELSSTAFGKIAIPHTIKMVGKKTGMVVLINPTGIQWGDGKVFIVLMLCIHPNDKKLFHEIFDRLSDIFTEDSAIQDLIASKNYDHFTGKVVNYF